MTQRELLMRAAERGVAYRESLDLRAVAPDAAAVDALQEFVEPLPACGVSDDEILAQLDRLGSPATMAMAGPRFFGFVIGGSLPVTVATNWLATAWDQNVSMSEITPAPALLESVALGWMKELFGLPKATAGAFVTGATVANFTALAAARNRVLAEVDWNVEAEGLIGAPDVTVVVGDEAHPTLIKALGLLGFGRERVVRVPVDGEGRMRIAGLPPLDGPSIVCTQVGNVNTGACDPVGDICRAVRPAGAWVHVDGAFGLWAAASPAYRQLVDGIGLADSWATDAHKWLNVPYDSGIAFVRDAAALTASMAVTADYLMTASERRNPSDFTPELSRRARGVDIWAALKSLGREGVAALVERCCANARRFADGLRAAGFEVLNDVVLNQVLVSFGSDDRTRSVIDRLQKDGTCWCGVTVWQGTTAMRISVSNWSTSADDVDTCLDAIVRAAAAE
ncbi:MAG: pyridoxal-dependent decarboxylase [Woeseiaceae bacterium]|nr:pyridoxal-dependent decarboxylase [Woeseiaceae bacterium]